MAVAMLHGFLVLHIEGAVQAAIGAAFAAGAMAGGCGKAACARMKDSVRKMAGSTGMVAATLGKLTADDGARRAAEGGNEAAALSLTSATANAPSSSQSPEPDFDAAAAMLGKDDAMAVMGDLWDEANWEAAEKDEQGKVKVDHFIKIAEPLSKAAAKAGARRTYAEIKAWRTEFRQREGRKPHSKDKGAIQGKYAMCHFYTQSYNMAKL